LRPAARNFPTVDSILYNPNDSLAFTCIQTTVSSEHPIAVSGLKHIQSWLKPKTTLAALCPTKTMPWRFIFVVPQDTASDFKLQKLQGDTATGAWVGKVQQHVLGLDVLSRSRPVQLTEVTHVLSQFFSQLLCPQPVN